MFLHCTIAELPPNFINEDDSIYKQKGIKQAIKTDFIHKTKIEIKPYLTFQSKFGSGQQKENMQCYDMYYYL